MSNKLLIICLFDRHCFISKSSPYSDCKLNLMILFAYLIIMKW